MKPGEIPKAVESYFYLYPVFHMLEVFLLLAATIKTFNPYLSLLLIFACYFQAPLIWRYMLSKYGRPYGAFGFGKKAQHGNNWLVAYQLQVFYTSFPFFERVLKMIPGAYSAWLRMWGAQIGKKVNWTSGCEIVDRTHLTIGDRCLIGNQSYISAHFIIKENGKYVLYVKDVTIGNDVVLALQCVIAPGAVLKDKVLVEAGGAVYPSEVVEQGVRHERFEELFNGRFYPLLKKAIRKASSEESS